MMEKTSKVTASQNGQAMQTLSSAMLLKYTLMSILLAVVMLVTVILPAEYNIDPTGIGQKLGLTVYQAKPVTDVVANSIEPKESLTEVIEVVVPAGKGVEYKFVMEQYQKLTYEWFTDGDALYFDLHGEPAGDTTGYFESYTIASLSEINGSFTTPFAGSHGWYWKNETSAPITVQLIVNGDYISRGLK